jgi:hypothetical protein
MKDSPASRIRFFCYARATASRVLHSQGHDGTVADWGERDLGAIVGLISFAREGEFAIE